jgi:hypothetical protein
VYGKGESQVAGHNQYGLRHTRFSVICVTLQR